jgi:hypothetical protein
VDPITDVFKTMHVASVVHARLEATAPWGLTREGEAGEQQAPHSATYGISPSQFAHFGMVSRGNCWLSVEGIPAPHKRNPLRRRWHPDHPNLGMVQVWPDERQTPKAVASGVDTD